MSFFNFYIFFIIILMFFFTSFIFPKKLLFFLFPYIFFKNEFNNIILTFDDGPSKYTIKLLEFLKDNNIKAIFFVNGYNIEKYKNVINRIIKDGHILANHSFNHKHLILFPFNLIKNEIFSLHKKVYDLFNYKMTLFRPPYGQFNFLIIYIISLIGYRIVLWDIELKDWNEKMPFEKIKKILDNKLKFNSIVLLHDGGGNRERVIEIVKYIKELTINNGYKLWTIN